MDSAGRTLPILGPAQRDSNGDPSSDTSSPSAALQAGTAEWLHRPRSYPASLRGSFDTRLTQSWHSGGSRREVIVPIRPLSRSFDGTTYREYHETRTFGGIERPPKAILPTSEEKESLMSFVRQWQRTNAQQKPHVVAFVNSRSGGQTGELLMSTLQDNIGARDTSAACTGEVCDLSHPEEPERTIEKLAKTLDQRSAIRRLLVCGGDGTVTWILTALEQCRALAGKHHLLPVAIVPLGTGNDLARSLGWGGKLGSVSDILQYLRWIVDASPVKLDQWRVLIRPHEPLEEGHKLLTAGSHPQLVHDRALAVQSRGDIAQALGDEVANPNSEDVYIGFWQNYFSIGIDAKVARFVDLARSETKCGQSCFRRGCGKVCYAWQGVRKGCCHPLLTPSIDRLRFLRPDDSTDSLDDLQPPLQDRPVDGGRGRMRQLMLVNINSYGAGLDVLPPVDRADAAPSPSDGILEVLGLRNAFTSLGLFARLRRPTYLTSTRAVAFRLATGEYMQMDGEPWKLPVGCDILVEPHRQLTMLCAPKEAPFWKGQASPSFWEAADVHPSRASGGVAMSSPVP